MLIVTVIHIGDLYLISLDFPVRPTQRVAHLGKHSVLAILSFREEEDITIGKFLSLDPILQF